MNFWRHQAILAHPLTPPTGPIPSPAFGGLSDAHRSDKRTQYRSTEVRQLTKIGQVHGVIITWPRPISKRVLT
ncbi:MAG: hypothetical protein IRY92_08820 [Dactylosporangium sp.]|nr:hypothetical protein [Dactylosporangium sp.]